jgi:hypothetical protein
MQKLALQASSAEAWNKGYVESWHNARAQLGVFEGTETAALPTLGIEGRFSAALQTWC